MEIDQLLKERAHGLADFRGGEGGVGVVLQGMQVPQKKVAHVPDRQGKSTLLETQGRALLHDTLQHLEALGALRDRVPPKTLKVQGPEEGGVQGKDLLVIRVAGVALARLTDVARCDHVTRRALQPVGSGSQGVIEDLHAAILQVPRCALHRAKDRVDALGQDQVLRGPQEGVPK